MFLDIQWCTTANRKMLLEQIWLEQCNTTWHYSEEIIQHTMWYVCLWKWQQTQQFYWSQWVHTHIPLTFNHDHVDVDGTDWRLWQPLSFLQQVRNIFSTDVLVRPLTICEQLPHCNTCTSDIAHITTVVDLIHPPDVRHAIYCNATVSYTHLTLPTKRIV